MKLFKNLMLFILILFFSSNIFADCSYDYNLDTFNIGFNSVYVTDINYNTYLQDYPINSYSDLNSIFRYKIFDPAPSQFKLVYLNKIGKRLLVAKNDWWCGGQTNVVSSINVPPFEGYHTTRDLVGNVCNANIINVNAPTTANVGEQVSILPVIQSSLEPFQVGGGVFPYVPTNLKQDYYWMNTELKIQVLDSTSTVVHEEILSILLQEKTNTYTPATVTPWTPTTAGTYTIKITTDTGVEPKCDGGRSRVSLPFTRTIVVTAPAPTIGNLLTTNVGTLSTYGETIFVQSHDSQSIDFNIDVSDSDFCEVIRGDGIRPEPQSFASISGNLIYQFTDILLTNNLAQNYTITCNNPHYPPINKTFYLKLDSDGDGVANDIDNCPNKDYREGTTDGWQYSGCPYEYTVTSACTNEASFDEINSVLKINNEYGWPCSEYYTTPSGSKNGLSYNYGIRVSMGSGSYSVGKDGNFLCRNKGIKGTCQLRQNTPLTNICDWGENKLTLGQTYTFYKYDNILPSEMTDTVIRANIDCSTRTSFDYLTYQFASPTFLSDDYTDITRNLDGTISINDDTTTKVNYDENNDRATYTNLNGTTENITLPTRDETKTIKIYKDGKNIRNDTIEPSLIGMKIHKIKHLKNKKQAEDTINQSVNLMQQFDIVKNLTFDGINTKVQINLENIPQSSRTNLTIYQVIDKSVANDIDDINFISDGGGQRIVLDKDPIIGWYFNDSGSGSGIEYEVPGENEGGTIIITQEPILFNEGELVINYREGGVCTGTEVALFEVNDLEASKISTIGTGDTYTICISHVNNSIQLYNDVSKQLDLHILNYSVNGNLSMYNKYTDYSTDLSVDQPSGDTIYWDMRVQSTNPDGTYSCLGSINDLNDSLFGDCGYTENRIWLHLGDDQVAPTTQTIVPYLAHTITIEIDANDNTGGSGLNKTYYCYDEDNSCTPNLEYSGTFQISCGNDWGCIKYIRTYSTDLEGNVEIVKSTPIKLIDKGSACQSDCTAKPSPNRFLKECRNLNGCEYATSEGEVGDNKGLEVANLCDLLLEGAYVKFNATHEIMCPMGPYRESRFVDLPITLEDSTSMCKDLMTYDYPVLFEGESVIMKVVSCMKYY